MYVYGFKLFISPGVFGDFRGWDFIIRDVRGLSGVMGLELCDLDY